MDEFSIRDELERIVEELNIDRKDFHEAGKVQWIEIIHKTEEVFLQKKHFSNSLHWGWNFLKEPQFSLGFVKDDAYAYLPKLIDEEYVWFMVEDYKDKIWVYEVNKAIISNVIAESMQLREYYLVSKKFEWILCENHHGILCGSGNEIVSKMRSLKELHSEKVY